MTAAHNRWAPNCEQFPTKVGPDTQYLIDLHRGETCPVCDDVVEDDTALDGLTDGQLADEIASWEY